MNKNAKWWGASSAALVALIGVAYFWQTTRGPREMKEIPGLRRVPEFSLPNPQGKNEGSSDYLGKVYLVHFWAAWCAPCVPEVPEFLNAASKLPKDRDGNPIHWILVSQDDSWEKARKVLNDQKLPENVHALLDSKAQISDAFGSYQFPETYLVTREGGVITKWIGSQEWNGAWGDKVRAEIEELSRTGRLAQLPPTEQR
ncbi:MAG: TlpA family protein disulfide reductase [Proteobacteria bacterium]|nr:MAG: TlpA family protein disulfide reductase [Pseudomonadota bacterium]